MKTAITADATILANYSVAVHFMRLLTDYADRRGLPLERLWALAGIHRDILNDPNDRVRFSDFARACDLATEALFRCPLRFNAAETAIGFPAAYLKLPLPHADTQVNRIMRDLCAQLTKKLGNALEPAWLVIARKTVLETFKHGMPDITAVAKATGMTEAELKELLSARGITFRSFVDELRQAMALGYIRDPNMGLVDIAYLLGFSEQSAFQRAFKRWIGMTPGEYRQIYTRDGA